VLLWCWWNHDEGICLRDASTVDLDEKWTGAELLIEEETSQHSKLKIHRPALANGVLSSFLHYCRDIWGPTPSQSDHVRLTRFDHMYEERYNCDCIPRHHY
jgi:hypothetical protein